MVTAANEGLHGLLYRGTQSPKIKGRQVLHSWTPSMQVAMVYSAEPGDVWGMRPPSFLPGSTVHIGRLTPGARVLPLCPYSGTCSLFSVLTALRFGKDGGISETEAAKILTYMHNRETGRVRAGQFQYRVIDEDGDEVLDTHLGFSLVDPETRVRNFRDQDFYDDPAEASGRLEADTFVFADAPAVRRAATAQGWDAISYMDVFATSAPRDLLGEDAEDLDGVDTDMDLQDDEVPVHVTVRPLRPEVVMLERSVPTAELLAERLAATNPAGAARARALRW